MSSVKTQCKFVDTEINPNPAFNTPCYFECSDGTQYTYYYHFDGFDKYYNCQFCKLIGRKKDVFECLNENEWKECSYFKFALK